MLHALVQIFQIQRDDITADEEDHLIYGIQIWKGEPSRRVEGRDFRSTMPVTALHALPRVMEQILQPGKKKTDWGKSDIKAGRYLTILFTLGLLVYVFLFGQTFFGAIVGLICLAIAAADPNILAHGHLVTTDMAATFFCIATLFHLYQWVNKHRNVHFVLFTICMALAQTAKINNLLLYPVSLLILVLALTRQRKLVVGRFIPKLFFFLIVQLVVINLAFQFNNTGFLIHQTDFSSSVMQNMVHFIPASLPSPLPLPYIDTFDQIYFEIETRNGLPLNYLLGQLSNTGFWNYFLICMGIKTPLTTLAFITASIVLIILQARDFTKQIIFLIVPALIIFWFISAADVQNGYRYALPILILGIISGMVLVDLLLRSVIGRTIVLVSLMMLLLETFSYRDGYIPFTNVLVADKKNAWKWLADSNLNWEQNRSKLKEYLKSNPDLIYKPEGPVKGLVVVDVNDLAGIWPPGKYIWLTDGYKANSHLWNSYIVFDTR
jgi:hypothetical protein